MALLLPDNTYLKLELNGDYIIYKNRAARNAAKKTSPKTVIAKYVEIIEQVSAESTAEANYYDSSYNKIVLDWLAEFTRYKNNLQKGITTEHFPLMSQYIKTVDKSIPVIIRKGHIRIPETDSLEEVYNFIKKCEVFGKLDEIEDI